MRSNPTLFYSDKQDKAVELTREMLADGWTKDDIEKYWWCLGYDTFFYTPIINKAQSAVE